MLERIFQKELQWIEKRGERQKQRHEAQLKYAEYYPHREGAKVSNVMLAIIVIMIVGYVIASFVLQYHTSIEMSPTITTCWFAFWTVEIVALAGIRISKVFKTKNHDDEEV